MRQNKKKFIFKDVFLKEGKYNKAKNKKYENLCKYAPAISSSPNGPPNLLVFPSNPKISFPKLNLKITSRETNKTQIEQAEKKILKLI